VLINDTKMAQDLRAIVGLFSITTWRI